MNPRALLVALPLLLAAPSHAQGSALPPPAWDNFSDTWAATDALGRALPLAPDVRSPRANKQVGIFYFLWHGAHGTPGPYDISKLLAANPNAPQLGPASAFHWWGEPEAGYYRASDAWVVRRNLSLLSDAGVDVLFFDVTNGPTYLESVKLLCETARSMRAQGNRVPQISFITHSSAAVVQQNLYNDFYAKNLYPELWYRWQGKPLLLGDASAKMPDGKPQSEEVRSFFTWRYSWAWDAGPGKWQWIDAFPQDAGLSPDGKVEQMPVAVASHPTSNIGRSYQNKTQPPLDALKSTATYNLGLHFEEQWKRALEVDPPFVFVDGWNEWVAQRFVVDGPSGPDFLGKPTKKGDSFFVDAYNREFNRDIEPTTELSSDSLYFQMAAAIRRFKGARPVPLASRPRTIGIDGSFREWQGVGPEFRDTVGDTAHRDAAGWGDLKYLDASGRNDIVASKAARDKRNLYFYARTNEPLSPHTGTNWMMLFVDADQNASTGWNGYDFALSTRVQSERQTALSRWDNGWKEVALCQYARRGNEIEIAVPQKYLQGFSAEEAGFDFHWVDNAAVDSLSEWFTRGDSAPNRRFNFRFRTR